MRIFLRQFIWKFTALALMLLCGACQTPGFVISESYIPAKQTRVAVVTVLGPARTVSQNGREITTQYHDRNLKYIDVTAKTKERLYTKVTILGARRPFDVAVETRVEHRDPATREFVDAGLDENLSAKQGAIVQEALHQSRDKSDAIDVEIPF